MMTTINKKMSKIIAFVVICALAMTMSVGCGNAKTNEKPEIIGAGDFNCIVNEPVDLLRSVAALDKEDGDITPQMQIDISPAAQVNNGIAVFAQQGSYTITYTVTDSDGNTTTAESYVSVYARAVHKAFDLVDMNGFSVDVSGSATLASQSVVGDGDRSHLLFKVTGAQNDADAVLSRTYSLGGGHVYTFKYNIKSNVAGTAKAKVGEADAVDLTVAADDNELTFTHDLTATSESETADVKVQLMLGGLGNDIDMEFVKAETSYQAADSYLVLTSANVKARFDGVTGTAETATDKKSATLKITSAADADWKGGMFIDTGYKLIAGAQYTVSFDATAKNSNAFGIVVQNKQWDEDKYDTVSVEKEGLTHKDITFTPTVAQIAKANELWLYVMSGNQENEITIANIEVTRGDISHTTYTIEFVKEEPSPEVTTNVTFSTADDTKNVFDRFDGVSGTVEAAEDNSTATLKITTASDADWKGGMFINTGCTLVAGAEYTVSFDVTATNADKFAIKVQNRQWDEKEYKFINVEQEGVTQNEFTFTPTAEQVNDRDELWLYVMSGNHVNEIVLSNLKVVKSASVNEANNVFDRFDGATGTVEAAEDKSSATLKITTAGDADWKGGMFINTGCTLAAGVEYKVSFDITGTSAGYAVKVQNRQWDEKEYKFINVEQAGSAHKEVKFTPTAEQIDDHDELWLYVMSGDKVNEITLSNLKVELTGESDDNDTLTVSESFTCHNVFKMFAYDGAPNYVRWENGKLLFTVPQFSNQDYHNKIEGPEFEMGTAEFGDYVISFKAKASAPIVAKIVGPKIGGWDPNVVYADGIKLSETETVYTYKGNALNIPAAHRFEWQFGYEANQKYENVTIEISEITIWLKSFLE